MALNRAVPGVETLGGDFGGLGGRARWTLGEMVGRSSSMERLFLQIRYLANHLRLGLIEGERGTGKLLTAETLHGLGTGRSGKFVTCTGEEFFSGTVSAQRLEEAQGGTLYLARVDMLRHEAQGRLLHLLGWLQAQQARASAPLRPQALPAVPAPRVLLVSSERPLRSLVLYGKFRSELHQQLSPVQLLLPPLRERRGDIPVLAELFLSQCAQQYGKLLRGISAEALAELQRYSWPGNVGELRTVITRGALRSEREYLRPQDLQLGAPAPGSQQHAASPRPPAVSTPATLAHPVGARQAEPAAEVNANLDPNLDRAILRHIRRVLAGANGNKLRAARLLGISRSTLYRLLDSEVANSAIQTPQRTALLEQ